MNATTVRPRSLVHRGHVEAAGLWFDSALYPLDEARRRVLASWDSGARVFEVEGSLLLRFAAPRQLRADEAMGAVLTERAGWLVSAPLSPAEWREWESQPIAPAATARAVIAIQLLLVKDAALVTILEAQPLDPGDWLDAGDWHLQGLEPLGQVAPLALVAPVAEFNARRALDVPASPELERFLAKMRGEGALEGPRPSWREHLLALMKASSSQSQRNGDARSRDFGGLKTQFSLRNLFQFHFGANGEAPPLRQGERFSSELGFLLSPLLWIFALAALWNLLGNRSGSPVSWLAILSILALMAGLSWALLVLSRLIPTPQGIARSAALPMASRGSRFSFDMMALLLLSGLAIGALQRADWISALRTLMLAFGMALWAHWKRRRLDPNLGSNGRNANGVETGNFGWLRRLFQSKKDEGGAGATQAKPRANPLNMWLWRTELSRLFGARQARYMMQMMQMFERGDLDAALRHAVPFNLFGEGAVSPAITPPRPRADLDFLGARGGGGTAVPLPPAVQERLTLCYRDAHAKLAAQNRVDEAAFVLAELLDSPLEAVQFLEKHDEWLKAAQLAETRDLDAGLTVRLWWRAGNRPRAVLVAKRRDAFADGVSRLEREGEKEREAAQTLRLLWAQNLALGGDYAGAVEAVWPVAAVLPEVRKVVGTWIERGLEGQGMGAARMLARQAHFLGDLSAGALERWRERVVQLLADPDEEGVKLRLSFATLLCEAPPQEMARAAARRTIRALARDAANFPVWSSGLQTRSKALIDFAADGPLRVDAAGLKFPAPPQGFAARPEMLELSFEADDVGALAITDAAYLPDGNTLVALGESGARLLNRLGRTIAAFEQPCHRLVLSKGGERAIGVALRGLEIQARFAGDPAAKEEFIGEMGVRELSQRTEIARLCRFDLVRKTVQPWGEAEIGHFAPQWSGGQWLVTSGDSLVSLDTTASAPIALWKTPDIGFASCMSSEAGSLAFLTHFYERNRKGRSEIWRFDLPSLVLRERRLVHKEVMEQLSGEQNAFIDAGGLLLFPQLVAGPQSGVVKNQEQQTLHIQMPHSEGEIPLQLEKSASWIAALNRSSEGAILRLWARDERVSTLRSNIELKGARNARFRLSEVTLVLCDDRGRLLALDLNTGNVLRDHRLF